MPILVLKIILTPFLITLATLCSRKWGPVVGGCLAGLPLTSGPVSVFLAIEQGPEFVTRSAIGTLQGLISVAAFCIGYAAVAKRKQWLICSLIGLLFFFLTTLALHELSLSWLYAFILVCVVLTLSLLFFPEPGYTTTVVLSKQWDIPLRMLVATCLVLSITGFARVLGPSLSGLLSPFPAFALILAVFAQIQGGAGSAISLLRGVVFGSYAFALFFVVVSVAILKYSPLYTYSLATMAAVGANVVLLLLIRRFHSSL